MATPLTTSTTVVFADLSGSTGVFEAIGNARAAEAISRLTNWIGRVCESRKGRVVKMLGDGVLAVFPDGPAAVAAVVELQRSHLKRLQEWPNQLRMRLKIGVAAGEVIEVDGDCYGDAVNVASRLSDLSGPEQIWASGSVISQVRNPAPGVRFRSLGPIPLRGKSQASEVFQIEWQEDIQTRHLTEPAQLSKSARPRHAANRGVRLSWLDMRMDFEAEDMPIHLGRAEEAEFPVQDQRVSRLHARIDWRNGSFVLTDMSTYGTWVRFSGTDAPHTLRREECVLLGTGEMALGASFEDFTAPTVRFEVLAGET